MGQSEYLVFGPVNSHSVQHFTSDAVDRFIKGLGRLRLTVVERLLVFLIDF